MTAPTPEGARRLEPRGADGAGRLAGRFEVVPSIDLRRGRVVRLVEGRDDRTTVYEAEPADLVRRFLAAGARTIHVVDLDAAFGEPRQEDRLGEVLAAVRAFESTGGGERAMGASEGGFARLQWGGGLRDRESVERALAAGIERVVVGSMFVRSFELFADLAHRFPGRVVPALDCRDGFARYGGWLESSSLHWRPLSRRLLGLPCPAVLVTDVALDGNLGGANAELASAVGLESGIPAIVSGGVASVDDVTRAAAAPGVGGVVLGRVLHEGRLTLEAALRAGARGVSEAPGTFEGSASEGGASGGDREEGP